MIELIIGLAPFLPALVGFTIPLVYLLTKSRSLILFLTTFTMLILIILTSIIMHNAYTSGNPLVFKAGGWPPPIGITYIVDKFTALMGFVTSIVLFAISLYSVGYIVDEGYPWYSALLLGNAAGLLGVIYTGDLFNLFVMLEVAGVSAYALVMYYRHRPISVVAGLKYAFIASLGTALYLLAMGLVYNFYGTLNLVDFSIKLTNHHEMIEILAFGIILVLSLWAFSIKSGVFPNHFWLPDAHPAAPTPISALLSGLVVNTGVIGLYKILYIGTGLVNNDPLGIIRSLVSLITILMGGLSAIVGALLMNTQRDIKRLIAYSTVMNLGFLFMGLGCLTHGGLRATLYYMSMHSFAKATLFLSAGYFIKQANTRLIDDLSGTGMRSPLVGFIFIISVLTLAGIPPLPGFLAKLMLYEALFELNIGLAIIMVIASAIGLLAYMKLLYIVVFETPRKTIQPLTMKSAIISMLLLSMIIILMGAMFLFNPRLTEMVIDAAARESTIDIVSYIEQVKIILKPL
ncbi:MAG: proton-conducting transporter membrane subunit [Desulfurococcaceae archaeon]